MRQSISFLCGFSNQKKGLRLQIILSFSKLESFNITGFKISSLQPQKIPVFQPNSPRILLVNYSTEKGAVRKQNVCTFYVTEFPGVDPQMFPESKSSRGLIKNKMVSACVLAILRAVFISEIPSSIFSISVLKFQWVS